MRSKRMFFAVGLPVLVAGQSALAVSIQGPSSSATPYVTPLNPKDTVVSIMTVGDSVNLKPDGTPYRMVGITDGLGAYDNGNGTFTLLMHHEIPVNINGAGVGTPVGALRAHGNAGAFVSKWTIDKSTLAVSKIEDLIGNNTSIFLSNNNPSGGGVHTGFLAGSTTPMGRLCSSDLAAVGAYQWKDPVSGITFGTAARIMQGGEEQGGVATSINPTPGGSLGPEANVHYGRQFAFVATDDPNTAQNEAGTGWELPHAGLFTWENNIASPHAQRKTVVVGLDDSNQGQLYVWVGDKQTTGNVMERAGLTRQSANDNLFVVKATGGTVADGAAFSEQRSTPVSGAFTLVNEGDVSGLTFAQLESLSDSSGGTQFLRPEDGQFDPKSPNDFYFVTTDQYDGVKDGVSAQIGRSRLYRLRFTDIENPLLGGSITAVLDGTEAGNMFDNMTIDENGRIILQEDVGNQEHNSKVWVYDIATDALSLVLKHDVARFGDIGILPTAPFSRDEETSGVIDVSHILGQGWFLADVQAHYSLGGELVEGGQLFAFQLAVPEPATMSLLGLAGLLLARRRSRVS